MQYYSFFFIYENTFFKKVSCFDFDAKIDIFLIIIYFSSNQVWKGVSSLSVPYIDFFHEQLIFCTIAINHIYTITSCHLVFVTG